MKPKPDEDFEALLKEFPPEREISQILKEKEAGLFQEDKPHEAVQKFPTPQDSLDLHNFLLDEALRRVEGYIRTSVGNGLKTVEIVTGKGRHSHNAKPILREKVFQKVIELKRAGLVIGTKWSQKTEARSGSLIVYLK